jgi:hypothetical protein
LVIGGGKADVGLAATGDRDALAGGRALHVPAEVVAELVGANRDDRWVRSGASRARTGDLVHAMHALSQLSYGPRASKCSVERKIVSPVDAGALVVERTRETQLDILVA